MFGRPRSWDYHGASALISPVIRLSDVVNHKDIGHLDLGNWTVLDVFDKLVGADTMSFQFCNFRMIMFTASLRMKEMMAKVTLGYLKVPVYVDSKSTY